MRFQIMCRTDGEEDFTELLCTDTVEDAKQVAVRLAMRPGWTVYVFDTAWGERVLDFEDGKHRQPGPQTEV